MPLTRLQAAMRDRAQRAWKEKRVYFKVGSAFKGCRACGITEEREISGNGKKRVFWLTGFDVFRAYRPWETKWTWRCWSCGAVDLKCWDDDKYGTVSARLGKEPYLGPKEDKLSRPKLVDPDFSSRPASTGALGRVGFSGKVLLTEPVRMATKASQPPVDQGAYDAKAARIKELELKLEQLRMIVKGGK